MDNTEIPEYFVCPISLEIMKDPVTTVTGITYDRESIERWLFTSNTATTSTSTCPVTMQPLPRDKLEILTPNHTLRRLIQSWCSINGVDPIPTPEPPLSKLHVTSLIRDLGGPDPRTRIKTLQKLEALAAESDRNRVIIGETTDLADSLISFIISCYEKRCTQGLEEALSLFYLVRGLSCRLWAHSSTTKEETIIESLLWILGDHDRALVKPYAAYLLRAVIGRANPSVLDRLKPEFFKTVLSNLRPENLISHQGLISILNILLDTCPWGKNRAFMVGLGAVFDLVEVEIRSGGEKKTTELVLAILCHLCSCAEGRAQLVGHAAGVAVVTRRILRVSSMADDSAVFIVWLVSRYSGTGSVLQEMLRVGTVDKLCMVMQVNCTGHLKEKAKEILRAHADVWRGSRLAVKLIH
ncbi:E3 ubiquitin-protein ligase pub24 [Phtheirospermum japonicum]|uniref:U-box domain-containing protein n=1 Tax=Phtheirospermum japonicum TaxID=374723 RepID=A0A830BEW1_9LAMI|nr:E3 ubiquitin-protein ligase pub24 [Phtheirospermum japonicum]